MASVVEEHHDENGLLWPLSIAPYTIHLIVLPKKVKEVVADQEGNRDPIMVAEQLYQNLQAEGIEVLFDDRQESPGVKFNDADLIGIPIRMTVSERANQSGGIEVKRRDQVAKTIVPAGEILEYVNSIIDELQAELDSGVVEVPFIQ